MKKGYKRVTDSSIKLVNIFQTDTVTLQVYLFFTKTEILQIFDIFKSFTLLTQELNMR